VGSRRTQTIPERRARLLWPRVLAAGAALVAGLAAPAAAAAGDTEDTVAVMRRIYSQVEVLLPLSVRDAAFSDPAQASRVREALQQLARQADAVRAHAEGDRRMAFLGDALARETRETLHRFESGRVEAAQFFVQRLADYCVACHASLPDPDDPPLASDFVDATALAGLPPERRATLQIATRRFDDALATLEAHLGSPEVHPATLLEPLTTYLTVALRVKNDPARALPVLDRLAERPDLWTYLRGDLERWRVELRSWKARGLPEPTLESARGMLEEARKLIRFPTDRAALVHYLLASAQLHRFLERHAGEESEEVAEAYYLLGLVESRVGGTGWWVSESDFHLETAIRMAPHSDVAARAFALLEEETLLGWSGSGGVHMPPDVRALLEELRVLARPRS